MGTIKGNTNTGRYGRVVINRDGSMTLHNVVLEGINITNCDLTAESGENPIPFADRMNTLEDWSHTDGKYPFYARGEGGEEVQ